MKFFIILYLPYKIIKWLVGVGKSEEIIFGNFFKNLKWPIFDKKVFTVVERECASPTLNP